MISEVFSFNGGELPRKSNAHSIRMISRENGVRSSPSRRAVASPSIWQGCPRAQRCRAFWLVLLRVANRFYDDESNLVRIFSQIYFKVCHAVIGDVDGGYWSKNRLRMGNRELRTLKATRYGD